MNSLIKIRSVLCRYKLTILVVAGILLLWSVAAGYTWNKMNARIAANETSYLQAARKSEEIARQIAAKKQQELKDEEDRKKKEAEGEPVKQAEQPPVKPEVSQNSGNVSSCNPSSSHNNPSSVDVLVNKKHCLQPLSFAPEDLVTTNGATISAKAASDFNRMIADAAAAGQGFTVSSSYRSYATQVSTYNYWVSVNGQQGADTVSARPGYSEHQTGLAIDVGSNNCILDCFGGTSQYQWFQAYAANYGFIQRYYSGHEHITGYASEEWHYRYVGVPTAQDMRARGIKTLEQYWGLDGGSYR